mgnify:CR=1 FL=1
MIYDISQPLFECEVYPGDPKPEKTELSSMKKGDSYNLTAISMCAHNGTHIDAPCHFIEGGKGVDQIDINRFIGLAYVETYNGEVDRQVAEQIIKRARSKNSEAWKKILIKGDAVINLEAAEYFAEVGLDLIGNESQTIGPEDEPMAVHLALLKKEVVLLEGIRLAHVPDGVYLLNCAPLNLTGGDGAPCRATLMEI